MLAASANTCVSTFSNWSSASQRLIPVSFQRFQLVDRSRRALELFLSNVTMHGRRFFVGFLLVLVWLSYMEKDLGDLGVMRELQIADVGMGFGHIVVKV